MKRQPTARKKIFANDKINLRNIQTVHTSILNKERQPNKKTGRSSIETFLQIRYGQKAHEKMFNTH